jgi:hypothetical protein
MLMEKTKPKLLWIVDLNIYLVAVERAAVAAAG